MSDIVEFARAVLSFPLFPRQENLLREVYDPEHPVRVACLRLGRRSGKGRIAALAAVWEATVNAPAHLACVPKGEKVAVAVIAVNMRQAGTLHDFIRSFLHVPALRPLIRRETSDTIELTNDMVILTLPSSSASTRGMACAVVILDEAAHFLGIEGSSGSAAEIFAAMAPSTAQFGEARIWITSTPRHASGWFHQVVSRAETNPPAGWRAWHATTAEMNPSISPAWLADQRAEDPAMYRREYEAEFDSGVGAVFDDNLIRAAIRDTGDIGPSQAVGRRWMIAIDPAFVNDRFAFATGYSEAGQVVIGAVGGWKGSKARPLEVEACYDEVAALAVAHDCPVVTDQFASQPTIQGHRARGVSIKEVPWTAERKQQAVVQTRRHLYGGRLSLPNHVGLVEELVRLETTPLPSGRTRIAAPPGVTDDWATSVLALMGELCRSGGTVGSRSYVEDLHSENVPVRRVAGLTLIGKQYVDRGR